MLSEHERNYGLGMDALLTVCSRNRNGIMVWAWMLWSSYALPTPYALPTRTEVWFGHGCSGQRMLFQHERNYGLGMDALVTVCSSNTNGIMAWAWMLWSPYALGTRTELWFAWACFAASWIRAFEGFGSQAHGVRGFVGSWGSRVRRAAGVHGCRSFAGSRCSWVRRVRGFASSRTRVRGFAGSRARGFAGSQVRGFAGSRVRGFAGLRGSRVRGFAGSRVRGFAGFAGSRVRGLAGWRVRRVRGFAGSRVRGFAGSRLRGVRGFAGSRVRGFAGSRVRGFAGSRVPGFAGSPARGLAGSRVRGFRGFTGCSVQLQSTEMCLVSTGDEIIFFALWSAYALPTQLWFGHGCSADRMLSEHERKYGLGMDALVTVCSSNTNGSMVWAWMLWSAYTLPTRTEVWFGHGCSGLCSPRDRKKTFKILGQNPLRIPGRIQTK